MRNVEFCYWLQGYFEIASKTSLNPQKIAIIGGFLRKIQEPLGIFTQWLSGVLKYLAEQDNNQDLLNFFEDEIKHELNELFHHAVQ